MSAQTMLYKSTEKPNLELGGRKLVYLIVDDADVSKSLDDGWHLGPDDAERAASAPNLLDRSARDIEAALPSLSDEELLALLDGETAGKTRKGVIAAIEAEVGRREGGK